VAPLLVTALWIGACLLHIDRLEAAIAPRSGLSYAVFVQLSHCWTSGLGWEQTVHPSYEASWHWGGHYGVVWFATAWLSSLWESPWALARIQVVWVGLGCLSSWLLGQWEGRWPGAVVGLLLYASAGAVLYIGLDDYQDLTLCLPLIPLAIACARYAPWWVFAGCCLLLCCVREELWLLVPLAGLCAGWARCGLAALVAALWFGALCALTPILHQVSPLQQALGAGHWIVGVDGLSALAWGDYALAAGAGLPWFLGLPGAALAVLGTVAFHGQAALHELTRGWVFSHQLAPVTGFALAGATVVLARLARGGGRRAGMAVGLAVAGSVLSLWSWWPRLDAQLSRAREPHPAGELIRQVPPDAVLYLPSDLAPAAARRRWLATEQSLGARVPPERVDYAVVPAGCGVRGEERAQAGSWLLLASPAGLPGIGEAPPWQLARGRPVGGCARP